MASLPHARGGVSNFLHFFLLFNMVFPTPVGVFPYRCDFTVFWASLPHARGGVSLKSLLSPQG